MAAHPPGRTTLRANWTDCPGNPATPSAASLRDQRRPAAAAVPSARSQPTAVIREVRGINANIRSADALCAAIEDVYLKRDDA